MALLSVAEALARVTSGLTPLEAERAALGDASGRVLAEDLAARLTQPPFDASAMDGYAVRAADVASLPATLKLIGASLAGAGFAGRVGRGEAVRIFTGAPVPRGADTVVIQENTDEAGGMVSGERRSARPAYPPARAGLQTGRGAAFSGDTAWSARAYARRRHEPG